MKRSLACLVCLSLFLWPSRAQDSSLAKDLELVVSQGKGSVAGRAAWERVVAAGPAALPHILRAMNGQGTPACNWLRTAFDQIVTRASAGGKAIDLAALLAFAKDAQNSGRARRLALELVESRRPGTSAALYPGWLEDAEFRYEAVALTLEQAREALKKAEKKSAHKLFHTAFTAARDVQQGRNAAAGLKELGVDVSVGKHLGFLMDWWLIGPFDGQGQKGFHLSYPPEKKVDLTEELPGQNGKPLRWKRYHVKEAAPTSNAKHQALVDLRSKDALGDADDGVAFAYTEFTVDQAQSVEFRGAADDNFTVWVNGVRVFGFEEYRNGVRLDRHRFKVELKAGKNTVLVKICQSAAPNPEPNWEFFLRVVDETGRGIAMK